MKQRLPAISKVVRRVRRKTAHTAGHKIQEKDRSRQMLLERLGKELLYFDGGMGTLLQSKGLQPGELPEVWNLEQMLRLFHLKDCWWILPIS